MRVKRKGKVEISPLIVVQSTVCGLILLVAGCLRLIGGRGYDVVRGVVYEWLTDGGVADALVAMSDG